MRGEEPPGTEDADGLLAGMENKVLAEQGTPASELIETRYFPTGIQRSWLLRWIGVAAILILIRGLLWGFAFGH